MLTPQKVRDKFQNKVIVQAEWFQQFIDNMLVLNHLQLEKGGKCSSGLIRMAERHGTKDSSFIKNATDAIADRLIEMYEPIGWQVDKKVSPGTEGTDETTIVLFFQIKGKDNE